MQKKLSSVVVVLRLGVLHGVKLTICYSYHCCYCQRVIMMSMMPKMVVVGWGIQLPKIYWLVFTVSTFNRFVFLLFIYFVIVIVRGMFFSFFLFSYISSILLFSVIFSSTFCPLIWPIVSQGYFVLHCQNLIVWDLMWTQSMSMLWGYWFFVFIFSASLLFLYLSIYLKE